MRMTNAERQARYRQRALHDPDGYLLTRLQVMLAAHPAADLERLYQATGLDKRQLVERAISAYYRLYLHAQAGNDAEMQRTVAVIAPELLTT